MDFDLSPDLEQDLPEDNEAQLPEDMEAQLLEDLGELFDMADVRGDAIDDMKDLLNQLKDVPNKAILRMGKETLDEIETELLAMPADTEPEFRQTLKAIRRELRKAIRSEDHEIIAANIFVWHSLDIMLDETLDHEEEDDQ